MQSNKHVSNRELLLLNHVRIVTRLNIQLRVIASLMVRDMMARYGRGSLGFLWLFIEPIFLVSGVIIIWSFAHDGMRGVPVVTFVISGYMPLTLWRHLSNHSRLMSGSYGLLYHRQISVIDIILARALSEIAAVTAASLIVYVVLLSIGYVSWIKSPSMLILGWSMMSWFGFANGCLAAGLSEKSEVIENLIQPYQYLLLPISGCFYMASWLPLEARQYVLLIPLPHIYEMIRYGFVGDQMTPYYSVFYVVFWCVILTSAGIWSMVSSRKNLSGR